MPPQPSLEGERISTEDEVWLDGDTNHVDEDHLISRLKTASDYEGIISGLGPKDTGTGWKIECPWDRRIYGQSCSEKQEEESDCDHIILGPEERKKPEKKKAPEPVFTKKENATLAQRIEILNWYHSQSTPSQTKTAENFVKKYPNLCIKQLLVSDWLKNEKKWRDQWAEVEQLGKAGAVKQIKQVEHPEVDDMLELWIAKAMCDRVHLSGEIIRLKWTRFADLVGIPEDERLALRLSKCDYSVNYLRPLNWPRCRICTKKRIEAGRRMGHSTIISNIVNGSYQLRKVSTGITPSSEDTFNMKNQWTPGSYAASKPISDVSRCNLAWRDISSQTVRNCWTKAGILPTADTTSALLSELSLEGGEDAETALLETLKALEATGIEEMINVLEEQVIEDATDEIANAVQQMHADRENREMNHGDDPDDTPAEPRPMRKEALQAVTMLARFLKDVDGSFACALELNLAKFGRETRLEQSRSLVSTSITSYFTPK
ncbi:hypothetical protein DFH08DRAFT_820097 [Mycena albidolilacea]|uniref:Uncharacterized protein n=1 Tax=Mycena albidolilacea TaxID=1033008 RepID=A0AAD6ZDR9_9AGAR|nr:hypothetical protein DFH08DRAFT_820097 [Mycena albidolilacea]